MDMARVDSAGSLLPTGTPVQYEELAEAIAKKGVSIAYLDGFH
jgi:hypothetical protein